MIVKKEIYEIYIVLARGPNRVPTKTKQRRRLTQ
jgi:hypothetical protein